MSIKTTWMIAALALATIVVWGLLILAGNEIPTPQDVGWNNRNYR